jgi:hypothetical protein
MYHQYTLLNNYTMEKWIRCYSPDGDEDGLGRTLSEDEQLIDGKLVKDDLDRIGTDDTTVLGAGGAAGGLSGDGERTDEYDAAVMGLDD